MALLVHLEIGTSSGCLIWERRSTLLGKSAIYLQRMARSSLGSPRGALPLLPRKTAGSLSSLQGPEAGGGGEMVYGPNFSQLLGSYDLWILIAVSHFAGHSGVAASTAGATPSHQAVPRLQRMEPERQPGPRSKTGVQPRWPVFLQDINQHDKEHQPHQRASHCSQHGAPCQGKSKGCQGQQQESE